MLLWKAQLSSRRQSKRNQAMYRHFLPSQGNAGIAGPAQCVRLGVEILTYKSRFKLTKACDGVGRRGWLKGGG